MRSGAYQAGFLCVLNIDFGVLKDENREDNVYL